MDRFDSLLVNQNTGKPILYENEIEIFIADKINFYLEYKFISIYIFFILFCLNPFKFNLL